MSLLSDRTAFARLVTALRPWLDQVVVAGGWAHRLHRLHPLAQAVDHEPLVTLDADIVIPRSVGTDHTKLRDRLVKAGFSPQFLGDARLPIVHYSLADAESEFYAEFLAKLRSTARSSLGAVNDAVLEAVEIAGPARRGLHAEGLVAACRLGYDEIFGD